MSDPPPDRSGQIIRVAHNRDHPYKLINRTPAEDRTLSWEARGLLFYLLVKPDDWEVRFADLLRAGDAGREKLQKMLRELQTAGYLVRSQARNPATGRWVWSSTVYEVPGAASPQTALPAMVEPSTAEPLTVHPAINGVGSGPNTNHTEYEGPAPPAISDEDRMAAKVARLTVEEYLALRGR